MLCYNSKPEKFSRANNGKETNDKNAFAQGVTD